MPFKETKTLIKYESKVNIDFETLARIEFSDVEYLLKQIDSDTFDSRLERILYESLISKTASIYQLAMRAYQYLDKNDLLKKINHTYDKGGDTSLGKMGKYREDLFHNGIHFLERKTFYPFGVIEGRGFCGIRVKKGATYKILNVWEFHSQESEYAITSEGVFEIKNPGTIDENWFLIDNFPTITAINYDQIRDNIKEAIKELKEIWNDISKLIRNEEGVNLYEFLNEGGKWEIFEIENGVVVGYKGLMKLIIAGHFTTTPPKQIIIKGNSIQYK
jgi:hypothetical protein